MRVGLREANQGFSKVMKAVRRGEEVLVTERGKPLARIVPVHSSETSDEMVARLETTGLLRAAARRTPMTAWQPRPLHGVPMTRTLREERESS
jgi:prevent-host-death family protein